MANVYTTKAKRKVQEALEKQKIEIPSSATWLETRNALKSQGYIQTKKNINRAAHLIIQSRRRSKVCSFDFYLKKIMANKTLFKKLENKSPIIKEPPSEFQS